MVPIKDFSDTPDPTAVTLEFRPNKRVELIDMNRMVADKATGDLEHYARAVYCSHHTTAGFFDQNFCQRLDHSAENVDSYLEAFRQLFPPDGDYQHDNMDLREELSREQRLVEPRNADSHLTYIGSGLRSCVTYDNRPDDPVYFVELDGVNGKEARTRQTTIVGFSKEIDEGSVVVEVPVSSHPMDSLNLRDDQFGLYEVVQEKLCELGIRNGRVDIALDYGERNAGLTVNEYETLLMRKDLVEVLQNPMRFMAKKGYHMLRDPRAIPGKAKNYAKYDLVRVVNKFLDSYGLSESVVERAIDKFLSVPASRFLRVKRNLSLLASTTDPDRAAGQLVHGTYQSPILVQWRRADDNVRRLRVSFVRFV